MSLNEVTKIIEKHVVTHNSFLFSKRKKVKSVYYTGVCVTVPVKVIVPPK